MDRCAQIIFVLVLPMWLGGCSPLIPIPPGAPVSDLVLSSTSPDSTIQRLTLDGRSYCAPALSFEIPAGHHTVGLSWEVTVSDRCDPEENMCSATILAGRCSGEFRADPNERYRILLDSRKGGISATVQKRGSTALYLGQDEAIVATFSCERMTRRDRQDTSALVTF